MSHSSAPSSGVGRLTSFALGLVIFVSLSLIGVSGYLKFQLDRSEAVLAAPESALTAGQDIPEKLRHALGYSGFLGSAQTFLAARDPAAVSDMKAQAKNAQDVLARISDKTSPDAHRDLQSIVDLFAAAAQKADKSVSDTSVSFTASDLAPLYGALPVLDARIGDALSTGRFAAQTDLKFWATLLTLIAWGSLVTAAACASGFYLSLRGHSAAPFRALAQSVQNMARGDMRTPIWGMERQDVVGDLARAIDLARYHFSQLPDMSLLTEQGPIRIRFEGQARSLFEAMMQNIARDSENIRGQAQTLADSVNQQKEAVATVSSRIESALAAMYQDRQGSEQQIQQLLQSVAASAQSLHGAQHSAEAQLNHLIAYLEERARGMAEVTHITGKHVAQTLQSLSHTEHHLRASAEQNQLTVHKLAASTDELGERLFGAVSLLRAGGKVLTETAETTQGRLNEAISLLSQSEGSLRNMLAQGFEPIGHPQKQLAGPGARAVDAERMQSIVDGLEAAQRKVEECLAHQAEATGEQIALLSTHGNHLISQVSSTVQTLSSVTEHLRQEQHHFGETGGRFAETLENLGGRLEQRVAEAAGVQIAKLTEHGGSVLSQVGTAAQSLSTTADRLRAEQEQLGQIGGRLEQRVMESLGRAETAMQGINRLSGLAGQLGTMVERLGAFEPVLRASLASEDSSGGLLLELKSGFEVTTRSIERLREEFINTALRETSAPAPVAGAPVPWEKIVEKVMMANNSLAQTIGQQAERIETRLAAMDKKISAAGLSPDEAQAQLKQQAQVLSELATALGAIDTHMQEMSETIKNPGHAPSNNGRMAS